jgi:hypothetical protein
MSDGTKRAHTPEELCQLIRKLSEHFESAMIVVDGLDEITNDRAGVTRLLRSLNTVGGHIKTLFASRPEVDIGYELEEFVQVSIAAMSSDLRLYVASEIERRTKERKLRIRDPNLKDHIMTTLVDGADGMCVIYISFSVYRLTNRTGFAGFPAKWTICASATTTETAGRP